jgi:hypothetical protein
MRKAESDEPGLLARSPELVRLEESNADGLVATVLQGQHLQLVHGVGLEELLGTLSVFKAAGTCTS